MISNPCAGRDFFMQPDESPRPLPAGIYQPAGEACPLTAGGVPVSPKARRRQTVKQSDVRLPATGIDFASLSMTSGRRENKHFVMHHR